jgi:hypothetical protein
MTYIQIVKCNDPKKWYANYIGDLFLLIDEEAIEYKTRQPDGYINFVAKTDSVLIQYH